MLFSIFQRYNLKAIHNEAYVDVEVKRAVLNISKIQFESNSQRFLFRAHLYGGCSQYFKDTI